MRNKLTGFVIVFSLVNITILLKDAKSSCCRKAEYALVIRYHSKQQWRFPICCLSIVSVPIRPQFAI